MRILSTSATIMATAALVLSGCQKKAEEAPATAAAPQVAAPPQAAAAPPAAEPAADPSRNGPGMGLNAAPTTPTAPSK